MINFAKLIITISSLILIYLFPSTALAQDQVPTKEVRSLTSQVVGRTQSEWSGAWAEYKNKTNLTGRNDGTNLVPYLNMGCAVPARDYWDPKMVWIARQTDGRKSRVRRAMNGLKQFRKLVRNAMKKQSEAVAKGEGNWLVLNSEYDLMDVVKDEEINLQQSAELILFLNVLYTGTATAHINEPDKLDLALKTVVLHRLQCRFAEASQIRLDKILESDLSPFSDPQTRLAAIIITNAIPDPDERLSRLKEMLADDSMTEDQKGIIAGFIQANDGVR